MLNLIISSLSTLYFEYNRVDQIECGSNGKVRSEQWHKSSSCFIILKREINFPVWERKVKILNCCHTQIYQQSLFLLLFRFFLLWIVIVTKQMLLVVCSFVPCCCYNKYMYWSWSRPSWWMRVNTITLPPLPRPITNTNCYLPLLISIGRLSSLPSVLYSIQSIYNNIRFVNNFIL